MTLIYMPQLIETVEQAEALPVGTVATFSTPGLTTAAVKNKGSLPGWWLGDERVSVGETPGWTALLPVEAEEEQLSGRYVTHGGIDPLDLKWQPGAHRLVTPWTSSPSRDRRGDCA